MEDRYQHTFDGQEVNETDINAIATAASLADDHVFAELFRLVPGQKGVVTTNQPSALVRPSGSADAKTMIGSFRAFIGPLAATTGQDAYKNGRSAVAASSVDLTPQTVQHPAQATNNRWDLVYARIDVDIDGPSILRFIKTGTTAAAQQSVVTTKRSTVTISVVIGTPGATPAKPTIPADSGSSYYIPLAYVLLLAGHTLTSSIAPRQIDEVAPVVSMSRATGAASLRVANGMYLEGGVVLTNEPWTPSSGRPLAYLPPTMNGKEELHFNLQEWTAPRTVTLGGVGVIDNSVDWRMRNFKVVVSCASQAFASQGFASASTIAFPGVGYPIFQFLAQSFTEFVANKYALANLNNANTAGFMAAGSTLLLYVDLASGSIKCDMGATDPACNFYFWIEATGQYNNSF
jgi:hypothetical protein